MGIPFPTAASVTLLAVIALLQGGAAAGWWAAAMPPEATVSAAILFWLSSLWLLRPAPGPDEAAAPASSSALRTAEAAVVTPAGPAAGPAQRRRSPRFSVSWPVTIEAGPLGPHPAELRDISQGGARIAGAPTLEAEAYGLLRIEGISLPIPFVVLQRMPQGGELRVRFALSDLALDTFCRQLDRLVQGRPATAAMADLPK